MDAINGGREGFGAQPRSPSPISVPSAWGRFIEPYPLHMRFKDPEDENYFLPYFGALRMENDIYWAVMSALMTTRMFRTLYGDGCVSAPVATAHTASIWGTSAAVLYLILHAPGLYLSIRTKLLLALRFHRTALLLALVSLPAVQVVKWSRLLPEESPWQSLAPPMFDCITLVGIFGWQLPGVWQAVSGGVLMFAPTVRILRRCQPLAVAVADARRHSVLSQLAAAAEKAVSGLLPVTLSRGVPDAALAPCTQTNLGMVLTFGYMFPMLMCYAMEERCRLDYMAKRGLRVAAPSWFMTLVHAAALLTLSCVICWTGLIAIAPWVIDWLDLH